MIEPYRNMRLGLFLNVALGLLFTVAAVIVIIAVNNGMRQQALLEAQSKARIILDRNLATHTYFSQVMKPRIFAWSESFRSKDYFDHSWMSSTYAIREIEKYFQSFNPSGYYFKDAAINARSPENEADNFEKAFIQKLNIDKKLESESAVRRINGKFYLVVLRKGEVMEATCLRCHSNPETAPKGLTDYYGSQRSFHRRIGEAVSAVSLHIPLSEAYAEANLFSLKLSAILLVVLAALFSIQYHLYRWFLLKPLHVMQDKANLIATDESHLGEEIPRPFGRELNELTESFNDMSVRLRRGRDHLEEIVGERTEALRRERDFAQGLILTAQAIVLVLDPSGRIVSINPYLEMLSGYMAEEVLGKDWFATFIPEALQDRTREIFAEAVGDLPTRGVVNPILTKDGREIDIEWFDNTLKDEQGNVIGLVAVGQDITERKRAEEEIHALNEDLERRVAERTARLEDSVRELESLSYSLSHDLRTPLRGIDGFSLALLEEYRGRPLDEKALGYLDRIRRGAQRMGHLIDDLVRLSRVARMDLRVESVDLSRLVRELGERYRETEQSQSIDWVVQEGVVVRGDPDLLRFVLGNLLDNAWKFTGTVEHPRIEFGAVPREGWMECFVRDNGVGFDMAYVDKLFGAFQRLHGEAEFPGSGIGLAVVRRIVERHEGTVWAEGRPDEGATFFFTLPALKREKTA